MASVDGSVSAFREQPSSPESGPETAEREIEPSDLPGGTGLRPVSVDPDRSLRDEAVSLRFPNGRRMPASDALPEAKLDAEEAQARPWYAVVGEWRDWYEGYLRSHITYEGPDGETGRSRLENSYQPEYGKRYYAKIKDFERGVEREWGSLTTVMLTFTASNENAEGNSRCPADHMRDIATGWDYARKQLHQALSGVNWEYAKVWEPHGSGYGHMHVAVFVESGALDAERFRPVMRSYVGNTKPAGREAHTLENAVSVNRGVENLGSYISEYIGIFGDDALSRPMTEQMFYATAWATGTRRVDFSNGAHEVMKREQFRRETGLRPKDRGRCEGSESVESGRESAGGESWEVEHICTVRGRSRSHADPTAGGVDTTVIDGRPGVDPPPDRS